MSNQLKKGPQKKIENYQNKDHPTAHGYLAQLRTRLFSLPSRLLNGRRHSRHYKFIPTPFDATGRSLD